MAIESASAPSLWTPRASRHRNYSFLERDPILRRQIGTDPRFLEFIDRMRSDVAAQRERAMARGLLEVTGVLAPAQ